MLSSYHWHYIKVALFLYLLTLPMSPFTLFFSGIFSLCRFLIVIYCMVYDHLVLVFFGFWRPLLKHCQR